MELTLEQLVLDNLGLAKAIAFRYAGRGLDRDDLVGAAMVGLVKAARAYDPVRGAFAALAARCIGREVRQALGAAAPAVLPDPSPREELLPQERFVLRREVLAAVRGAVQTSAQRRLVHRVLMGEPAATGRQRRAAASDMYRRIVGRARAALRVEAA